MRERAWRNIMVSAINEGLRRKLFSLRPGDNQWPNHGEPYVYTFSAYNGIEAIACIKDAGFDEISIHVALWPTKRAEEFITSCNAGFLAGEAFARGWFLRQNEAKLQGFDKGLCCRKHLIQTIADIDMKPLSYNDKGPAPGYLQW